MYYDRYVADGTAHGACLGVLGMWFLIGMLADGWVAFTSS